MGGVRLDSVFLWSRIQTSALYVAPEIVGATHRFQHEGKEVSITLPNFPASPSDPLADRITCRSWQRKDGEDVPTSYEVHDLDVRVLTGLTPTLPEEMLRLPPKQANLVSAEKRRELDAVVDRNAGTAHRAFHYWVEVMRWKALKGDIARPRLSTFLWSNDLVDGATGHRFWSAAGSAVVPPLDPVKPDQWAAAQVALTEGKRIPVWFDFLFQGEYRLRLGDYAEAVLSFAVACETLTRRLYLQEVPCADAVSDGALDLINRPEARAIMDRWKRMSFWSSAWESAFEISDLHKLFNARNDVIHRGQRHGLTEDKCCTYAKEARKFVVFADRFVRSPARGGALIRRASYEIEASKRLRATVI